MTWQCGEYPHFDTVWTPPFLKKFAWDFNLLYRTTFIKTANILVRNNWCCHCTILLLCSFSFLGQHCFTTSSCWLFIGSSRLWICGSSPFTISLVGDSPMLWLYCLNKRLVNIVLASKDTASGSKVLAKVLVCCSGAIHCTVWYTNLFLDSQEKIPKNCCNVCFPVSVAHFPKDFQVWKDFLKITRSLTIRHVKWP